MSKKLANAWPNKKCTSPEILLATTIDVFRSHANIHAKHLQASSISVLKAVRRFRLQVSLKVRDDARSCKSQ